MRRRFKIGERVRSVFPPPMRPSLRHINANGTVADRLSCQPERSLCDRTLAPSPFTSNTAASDEPASPMFGGAGWIGEHCVNSLHDVARKFRLFSSGINVVRAPLSIATCSDSANDRCGLIFPRMLKSPRITTRAARRVQPRSVRARKCRDSRIGKVVPMLYL